MALQSFIPTVWAATLLQNLHKDLVFGAVANRNYEGEITGYGDTVKINSIGAITVGNYAKNSTSVSASALDSAQVTMPIDQAKYFAFYIDDVDKAQTKPKVMQEAMREASYALSDAADGYMAGFYSQAAEQVSQTSLTNANVISTITLTGKALDEKNVAKAGRWMVIPPFMHMMMVLAQINFSTDNVNVLSEGFIGRALGFDFYMSNNLKEVSTNTEAMAGGPRAISYAEQIVSVEAYRPEARFADAVKGLHVYGGKVVDPKSLVRVTVKASSASGI